MFLAMAVMLLCATNVKAGQLVSLAEVPFWAHTGGWGPSAPQDQEWPRLAEDPGDESAWCPFILGVSSGQPYGDSAVKGFADLSMYSKLIVTVSEGTPRFLFNRDVDEGQWNENEAESHLIDNTKGGWSSKYFTQDGNTYIVDLKQMTAEKGFCHLHAIKGANWANVTIESMEVETGKKVGWMPLINNSSMEKEDVSSFFTKVAKGDPQPSVITDGVGVNGSRGIVVEATAKESDPWDNQFWFRFNEPLAPEAKYRVSFDYRADADASVDTQAHAEPSDYIFHGIFGTLNFTTDWQTYTTEAVVTSEQSKPGENKAFQSVAFNLNVLADANNYYFDNIKVEVYKAGIVAEYSSDVIKIDFGFDTNIPELVKACGLPRLLYPLDCASVTVDGEPMALTTVEAFPDGRFYIFTEDMVSGKNVVVTLKNPADPAYHLVYLNGPGGDVPNFEDTAEENDEIALAEDAYSYEYLRPEILDMDPEDGSFNLPNSIKEFKLYLDKGADCSRIVATLNKEKLTVSPAEGYSKEITLVRTSAGDLKTGTYTIKVTNIFSRNPLTDDDMNQVEYTISVGKVEADPNDVPKDMIDAANFADCAENGIPVGFVVKQGEEERTSDATFGSGSRMFNFAEGGDFTKGLYFREGYAQYGSVEGYELPLEANKKYKIHFNSAMWKENGATMNFQILDANDESVEYFAQTINNTPNVNGSKAAVNGSTSTDIEFVPETTGNYLLRWSVGGFNEIILANVACKYMPSTVGIEETQLLNTALENAKTTRDANADERYDGAAYDALVAAIEKYEAEGPSYTAPSKFKKAAATLDETSQAVKDHRKNCDTYDEQIKKSLDVERQNAEKKFAATELYAQLKEMNAKYHGSSEWVTPEEDPEAEAQLVYTFDVLKDDAALAAAVKELTALATLTSLLFTEGVSAPENANGGKGTGVAVFIDRLRLGAEALKALGVSADDALVVAANNALTDDDALADQIKNSLKSIIYGNLKNADSELFKPTINELTDEEEVPSYDMSVFVKNPNIYKQQTNMDFTAENVPGWTTPEGYSAPGLTVGWGAPKHVEGVAEDVMFQTWGPTYRVEQTIEDLPVGVYTIKYAFGDRDNQEFEDSYAFATTSDGNEIQGGMIPGIGQAFPFISNDAQTCTIEDVVVADGILTIGVNAGDGSHTFFNEVRLYINGKVDGFDYGKAYEEVMTGVEPTTKTAKVRAIQLFDLNGRRISTAKKGVVIVQKQMSDGSIKVEKVIK